MISTNDVQQVAEVAQAIHTQVSYNWPAITGIALWLRVEAANVSGWILSQGGIAYIVKKLWSNPPAKSQ